MFLSPLQGYLIQVLQIYHFNFFITIREFVTVTIVKKWNVIVKCLAVHIDNKFGRR